MSLIAASLAVLIGWCSWTTTDAYPETVSTSSCFASPPGTSDRSSQEIRLVRRDWASHDLSTFVTEILLKEFLNYEVIVIDGTTGSALDWGSEMVAGDYDLDMEQWHTSSSNYTEYVTQNMTVLDLGAIGYSGRSGIFIAGSDALLAADSFADFWLYYEDAAAGIAAGLPQFGEIDLKSLTGEEYPVCKLDWCSSGSFQGYYVPPQCKGVLDDPTDCIEIVMAHPTQDAGYFEQLTTNLNLQAVHGYYANKVEDVVKDRLEANKPTLFYRWTPDPLVSSVSGLRLSFPDYYVGCASGDTHRADGPVSCDFPETTMRKLGSKRISKLPPAMYALQSLAIATPDIEGMLANHTSAGGPYSGREAACIWIKNNMDRVNEFVPSCISQPLEDPQTGDLVFDEDSLECVATTVYPASTFTHTCLEAENLTSADRSDVTLKIGVRGWTSFDLTAMLSTIMLKDLLGYSVSLIDLSASSTSDWGTEISDNLFDYDGENWQTAPDMPSYVTYMEEYKTVLDLGKIGYGGRGAMWTFRKTLEKIPRARYYKFWMDSSAALAAGLPAWKDIDMETLLGESFPVCSPEVVSWCPTGNFSGYWVPNACESSPETCVEFLMAAPTYDTAYFEQLTQNFGLKVIHGYYTMPLLPSLVKERYHNDLPTVFWWWEPDPIIGIVDAERISYPDYSYGCDAANEKDADEGQLVCDYPETAMLKLGSSRLPSDAPQAYFFLTQFQISLEHMNLMLADHVAGGGNLNTSATACKHLKQHWTTYKAYAPDCISNPRVYPNVAIGDTVFNTDDLVCEVVECPAYQVLASDGTRVFCQDCPSGLAPNTDQSKCSLCSSGTYVNDAGTACNSCSFGSYAELRGQTACDLCSTGSFVATTGATTCTLCEKGEYQDEHGQTSCKTCSDGKTTDSRGMSKGTSCKCPAGSFLGLDNLTCQTCPAGMECPFGSEYINIALYAADSSLVIPLVKAGYFTHRSSPLSVYMCNEADSNACPGGAPETCGNGRVGLICEVCPEGQALSNGVCTGCDAGPNLLLWVCFPLGLLLLAWGTLYMANDKITVNVGVLLMASVLFGLVITTFQSIALFPQLSMKWGSQGHVFDFFKFFIGSPDGVPLSCALSYSPVALFGFRCLLPAFCVVAVLLVWLCSKICSSIFRWTPWNQNVAFNSLGQILQALFIAIAVLVVQPVRCFSHPNGLYSMSLFPQVLCWEGGEHTSMVVSGALVGIFFVVPFMTSCIVAVLRATKTKNPVGHYQRWRFLLYRFRADVWWWGIVFLVRQLALAFSVCVPADSPHWQITYVALVTTTYMAAVSALWPWKHSLLSVVDVSSMLLLNAVIVSSGSFSTINEGDIPGFVTFHFVVMSGFSLLVGFVSCSIAYRAAFAGLRGEYTVRQSKRYLDTIGNKWIHFIDVSSKMSPETIKHCIEAFSEFDVRFLAKCMGSFQSIDTTFGEKSDDRLDTISHSSRSVEAIQARVKTSMTMSMTTSMTFLPSEQDFDHIPPTKVVMI